MKYILISPLRLNAGGWEQFSSHIYGLFHPDNEHLDAQLTELQVEKIKSTFGQDWEIFVGEDYKYHSLESENLERGGVFLNSLLSSLSEAFARVRRNSFAMLALNERKDAVLVQFNTGEACVIEVHSANGTLEEKLRAISESRNASALLVSTATQRLSTLARRAGAAFSNGETITHTVLVGSEASEVDVDVVRRCFDAEGLSFQANIYEDHVSFTPGWSFSVCVSDVSSKFWDTIGVMAKAQCEWYCVRVARDYCLRTLASPELTADVSLSLLLKLEQHIVSFQTEFRLWRHRMEEYRENLKPSLTAQAQKIENMWQTKTAMDYVNDTLVQSRNLIQSSYSRRLLVQERRQSLMIFGLTSLGILSLSSIAATYWEWLTLASIFEKSYPSTPQGMLAIQVMLYSLPGLTFALLIWFGVSRMRRD